ncbi:MAG: folate family ECF transporter S component [Clostridium sulfidigenes]|uniref:Folate family ECF transporter S component n=1 Tax=Clostridium sulfidigenes TaxID=318464 RepID=A0A927WA36_9CLOT|nr:folate family ECF transporter S component [Clostridium sulfidigenes]
MIFSEKKDDMLSLLKESSAHLKKTSSLTGLALIAAINIILGSLSIQLSPILKIGFSFIAVGISALFYGPVATGFVGVITDVIKYMIRPNGPFFIGFTFNEFLGGFITGLILYKKPVSIKRIFITRLVIMIVINLVLTPIWLSIMYGKGIFVAYSVRIVKSLILLPIETIVLYSVLKTAEKTRRVPSFK